MLDLTITIEQLEQLASEIEADETRKRERLLRLCRNYTRIIALREPSQFARKARHRGDEPGHWDSSYPPKQVYSDRSGPALHRLRHFETDDIAIERGFYYAWRRVTTDGGLYVDMGGRWWRANETGTGRVGQFAAHPGDCDVQCEITWEHVQDEEIATEELLAAEQELRVLAFPLIAAATSAA